MLPVHDKREARREHGEFSSEDKDSDVHFTTTGRQLYSRERLEITGLCDIGWASAVVSDVCVAAVQVVGRVTVRLQTLLCSHAAVVSSNLRRATNRGEKSDTFRSPVLSS